MPFISMMPLQFIVFSLQSIIIVPESDGRSVGDSLDMDEDGRKSVTFLGASPRGKSLSVYFHKQCMVSDKWGDCRSEYNLILVFSVYDGERLMDVKLISF